MGTLSYIHSARSFFGDFPVDNSSFGESTMKVPLLVLSLALALPSLLRAEDATPKATVPPPAPARFRLSDLLPTSLQKNPRLNLSIITEMSEAGRLIPAPTKDKPTYYVIWDAGLTEEGDGVAGERPPPAEKLAQIMKSSLAASGYLPANEKNPPTILLCYNWGSFNHLSPMDEGTGESDASVRKNVMMRAILVGGAKFGVDLMTAVNDQTVYLFRTRDDINESLIDLAAGDLYFVMVRAYDFEAAKKKEKKILWSTKIATDSQGVAMDDALLTIVAKGKTYFGHETNGAVLFHPRLFDGKVEIGEATVVPDAPAPQPAPPSAKKR
jgi:hypothetical protein